MIRLLAEAAFAMAGIGRILLFRKDWRERFNLTSDGLARSFGAILIGLPVYALMMAFFHRIGYPSVPVWWYALDLARLWLVFPLVAALAVMATGLKKDYGAWLTVRNWAVLAQLLLVTLVSATAIAGLSDLVFIAVFFGLFYPAFLTVLNLSIAFAVLRGPWPQVTGAGVAVILADFLTREGIGLLLQRFIQPS